MMGRSYSVYVSPELNVEAWKRRYVRGEIEVEDLEHYVEGCLCGVANPLPREWYVWQRNLTLLSGQERATQR